jgi:hypothetical protein
MSITRRIHSVADMEENVGGLIITKHKIRTSGIFKAGKSPKGFDIFLVCKSYRLS